MKILVLNGPNLNLLGVREPEVYGSVSLEAIETSLRERSTIYSASLLFFQSNHEGELIDRVHKAFREGVDGVLCNPAGYTHSSVALRDAFLATKIPFIEIHLSNVHAREQFRHHSYFSDIAIGQITGFGVMGYVLGLDALVQYLQET